MTIAGIIITVIIWEVIRWGASEVYKTYKEN